MKIAIVTAYYTMGRGYMENLWADTLARNGHDVTVLAGSRGPSGLPDDEAHDADPTVDLRRFRCLRLPSGIRFAGPALLYELDQLCPDVVLWINVGSHFGRQVLEHKSRRGDGCKLVCFFGENSGQHAYLPGAAPLTPHDRWKIRGWRFLRGPLYRRAIAACDLAVGITAETPGIIASLLPEPEREAVRSRFLALPLGYDGCVFAFDPGLRARTRAELGLGDDDFALVVSSRITAAKIRRTLAPLVDHIAEWLRIEPVGRVIVVGFRDAPESDRFRDHIAALDVADRFRLEPLAGRPRLNALFNAADLGVFAAPSISVQEAMGTGLYMLLSDDGSMDHLIASTAQGCFFRKGDRDSLHDGLAWAAAHLGAGPTRAERQGANAWLDYASLYQQLVASLLVTDTDRYIDAPAGDPSPEIVEPALERTP